MSRKLQYDTWLFSTATLIVVVGLVMIYSASAMIATQRFGHGPYYFLARQLAFLVAGSCALLFLMHVNPESHEVLDLSKEIARAAGKLTPARAWTSRPSGPGGANEPAEPELIYSDCGLWRFDAAAEKEQRLFQRPHLVLSCCVELDAGHLFHALQPRVLAQLPSGLRLRFAVHLHDIGRKVEAPVE